MINQYGPGELVNSDGSKTGQWVYVGWNDDFTWRLGYCTDEAGCEGHLTAEAAIEHFRQWLLDTRTRYDCKGVRKLCEIGGCGAITESFVEVDMFGWYFSLCDLHRKRQYVGKVLGSLQDIYG